MDVILDIIVVLLALATLGALIYTPYICYQLYKTIRDSRKGTHADQD